LELSERCRVPGCPSSYALVAGAVPIPLCAHHYLDLAELLAESGLSLPEYAGDLRPFINQLK